MKKLLFILFAILFAINLNTQAHDFSAVYNGDTIYYRITSVVASYTVAVTYRGIYSSTYNEYTGSVSIPDSVLFNGKYYNVISIGSDAFEGCTGLTSITIPNSLTSIDINAFMGCSGLTSVTIPNSVTSIGGSAFWGCSSLTSIAIPNSVTSIGSYAFDNIPFYTNLPNGLVYFNNILYKYKGTMPDNTSINIQSGTTSIADDAFNNCTALTSITIPSSVTYIGYSAFWNCSGLTSVTIPNSVTCIREFAFYNCSGLSSITIPNSVTYIGEYAFINTSWYNSQPNGLIYINNILYNYKGTMPENTSIIVQSGTESIAGSAFSGCNRLTSITIPNSVTSIGNFAFSSCNRLTSILIPDSVTKIGAGAFTSCSGLTSLTIPNSVTLIGNGAFYGCFRLTSISLPSSITKIDYQTFTQCSGLTSITIPNSVTSIGELAFYGCSGLTSLTIPPHINSIGLEAFKSCSSLDTIFFNAIFCNNVGDSTRPVFDWCNNLTTLVIGDSVQNIPSYAFYNRSTLTSIISKAINPPILKSNTFYGVGRTIPVYVPCTSIQSYNTTSFWSEFTNKITFIAPEFIDISICDGDTYNFNGTIIDSVGVYSYFNGCDSVILTLSVNPSPIVPHDLSVSNISMNYATISWQGDAESYDVYRDDSLIVNVTDTTYVDNYEMSVNVTYCYNIKAKNNSGCESALSDTLCFGLYGLGNIENTNIQTKLYPNPTNNKSKLEIEGLSSDVDVLVYDMIGRVIQRHKINKGNNELDIDLSGYAKGVYSIRIVNESINQTKKLIVQ